MQRFHVEPEHSLSRLDVYLTEQLPELSRSSVQKLCQDGRVMVNGEPERTSYKVRASDDITVEFDPKDLTEIPAIELPIIYEDDDCLVIDKPAGILTHSKGNFNPEATVATFIRDKVHDLDGERAGIVHRLDRATSGVMICAKTPDALSWLQKQFSSRKVKKEYLAVVSGALEPPAAVIDLPIGRNSRKPKTFHVTPEARPAETVYETLQVGPNCSLVSLKPRTGRTHQLRVHMHYLKHPIVGDELYDGPSYDRMLLHAHKLEITLPNKQRRVFESPLPPAFNEAVC